MRKLQEELAAVNDAAKAEFRGNYDLHQQTRNFEIEMIRHALYLTNNNQQRAAQMLGIKYTTLNAKVKRFGIR
ncbi:MAG TPA: helix-turn-helix domain-containing protein [Pyrinomonadaceae bacterium]|nr:helix-turn-helix domain-containing protein [Pyrinomonadaceae bacterium]